ncbi:MAG: hypothetical protein GY940_24530, partial [bacterium]|nr:hypothetical protein [bacterium]
FVIILVVLVLLPGILSSNWAKKKVLEKANHKLPGQIAINKWSFSWLDGIRCTGLKYDNRPDGLLVRIEDITTSKGLLRLVANHKDLGVINVKDPGLDFYLPEKSIEKEETIPPVKVPDKETTTAPVDESEKKRETRDRMALPEIFGQINITGGSVQAVFPDATKKRVLKDLDLKLDAAGLENPLNYKVLFHSGDNVGQVTGQGTITLPSEDVSRVEDIKSQADLTIEKWEIKDILSILAALLNSPAGSGQLNGRLAVSGSTAAGLHLVGNLMAEKIHLFGGPFKSDTPSIDRFAL